MMNSEKFVPQENELLLRRALAAEALLKSRKKQVGSCESFIIMLQPFGVMLQWMKRGVWVCLKAISIDVMENGL